MALHTESGTRVVWLTTAGHRDWRWRKKIEKTLSLPATGVGDEAQRTIFQYLKQGLKAYKSRRADPDSWILGGYATKEVIERAKFNPAVVGATITKDDVVLLGMDPGPDVDEAWWDDMLVSWFEEPEEEETAAEEEKPASAPDDEEPASDSDKKKAEV